MVCDLCNSAADYVHEALKNNQTREEIEEVRFARMLRVLCVLWGLLLLLCGIRGSVVTLSILLSPSTTSILSHQHFSSFPPP
jgi:hypothetical protein